MKRLFLSGMLLLSMLSFGQIKISPVSVGWPAKQATDLMVRVMPFETTAATCKVYYEIKSESGEKLADGNLSLTAQEFNDWGRENVYIENLVISRLGLTRRD